MKDFEKYLSSENPNEMSAQLFEQMARKDMKHFLKTFKEDYYEKLDFDKGCDFLDDAMPYFVPRQYMERKDAFNLFVKGHLKKGTVCYFLIHAIFEMGVGNIRVGVANVPHRAFKDYQKAKDEGNLESLKDFEHLKDKNAKPQQEFKGDNQCTRCGRTDLPLTTTIEARTMTTQKICSVCMASGGASGKKKKKLSLKRLDQEIAEYEDLARKYEQLIKDRPEMPKIPAGLESYAMTPLSNYKSIQAILADLRAQRMAAMTEMDSTVRLEYELKKSVEAEDYQQSAEIRDKLNKKKKGE
jgi:hypothetical protein